MLILGLAAKWKLNNHMSVYTRLIPRRTLMEGGVKEEAVPGRSPGGRVNETNPECCPQPGCAPSNFTPDYEMEN